MKVLHTNTKAGSTGEEQVPQNSQSSVNMKAGKGQAVKQPLIEASSSLMPSGKHAHRLGEAVVQRLGHPEQKLFQQERALGFYIPQRVATDFIIGAVLLHEADLHHDLAVSTLLGLVSDQPFETFRAIYWDHIHFEQPTELMLSNGQQQDNASMLQPYNMSLPGAVTAFQEWWSPIFMLALLSELFWYPK